MTHADATQQLFERLSSSLADGTFVRLILSRPRQGFDNPEKVLARCVDLKAGPHLSFTFRYPTKDITRNLPPAAGIEWVKKQVGREFHCALLATTQRDWQLSMSKSGQWEIVAHKPSTTRAPSREHDQARSEILDESALDWLHGLGVTDPGGKVRERMADKYRQINRYLEILTHLAADCGWRPCGSSERASVGAPVRHDPEHAATLPTLGRLPHGRERPTESRCTQPAESPVEPHAGAGLTIADMGSGKGYLTFGAWHLLRRVWQNRARVIGVEVRPELVESTNQVARQIGASGLEFISGAIDSVSLPRVDGLIALHACNTATDHAILRGIELSAKLILTAPCCHKELRPQMGQPRPLAPVLRHGVMEERMAEWVTDGLRALFLEWAGYRTKIFEFVSTEHTAKNLMISAVRENEPFTSRTARERIVEMKSFFGIKQHALDSLLEKPTEQTPEK